MIKDPTEIHARVEQRLRGLLADGLAIDDAVRTVHRVDGIGKLWLWRPVSTVAAVSPAEAKRLVVHALASWQPDQNGE